MTCHYTYMDFGGSFETTLSTEDYYFLIVLPISVLVVMRISPGCIDLASWSLVTTLANPLTLIRIYIYTLCN